MAFHMTSAAAQEILAAAERSGAVGMALRIAARPANDGIDYGMGFDDPAPGDVVVQFDGLTVLIGESSQDALAATVLDYVELDEGGRDFIFVEAAPVSQGGGCSTQPRGCGGGGCSRCG